VFLVGVWYWLQNPFKCKTELKYTSHCQSYIEKCLKVCYFVAVQDPPMFIDFEPGEDTFDRQVYKEYTQMGTKVKFLHMHTQRKGEKQKGNSVRERCTQFQHNMY
jgi:ferredoxin